MEIIEPNRVCRSVDRVGIRSQDNCCNGCLVQHATRPHLPTYLGPTWLEHVTGDEIRIRKHLTHWASKFKIYQPEMKTTSLDLEGEEWQSGPLIGVGFGAALGPWKLIKFCFLLDAFSPFLGNLLESYKQYSLGGYG